MNENTPQLQEPTVVLPTTAPLVRITAGVGSAGQKTWNLRRPVTLIGSSRPAHIVLHDKEISKAHCVIVNTGTDVLIKDLRTSSGTLVNRNPIDVAVLADGDVITIGSNNIQVAINLPEDVSEDSNAGLEFVDPVKFPKPIDLRLIHTDRRWEIDDAIVLIGRHEKAVIRLDHEDVSIRHAVIFRFGDRPAVFDLGCRTGIWVSGKRCSIAVLSEGDCLTVGPFGLSIGSPEAALLHARSTGVAEEGDPILEAVWPRNGHGASESTAGDDGSAAGAKASSKSLPGDAGGGAGSTSDSAPARSGEEGGKGLQSSIGKTWDRLNDWHHETSEACDPASQQKLDELAAREAELDARDASLRGQLHDVTRMHEKVLEREKEVDQTAKELRAKSAELEDAEKRFAEKHADLEQRLAEVQRRENALAQRWSRMRSATCPHCGKPTHQTQSTNGGRS